LPSTPARIKILPHPPARGQHRGERQIGIGVGAGHPVFDAERAFVSDDAEAGGAVVVAQAMRVGAQLPG
jgi:hypothetical protein